MDDLALVVAFSITLATVAVMYVRMPRCPKCRSRFSAYYIDTNGLRLTMSIPMERTLTRTMARALPKQTGIWCGWCGEYFGNLSPDQVTHLAQEIDIALNDP